jgi:hypothetical protein
VIEGVDVVAHNAARMLVSLRTGLCALLVGGCGGVVGGDTASWDVLSEKTATPASVRITIDSWPGYLRPPTKSAHPQSKEHHD